MWFAQVDSLHALIRTSSLNPTGTQTTKKSNLRFIFVDGMLFVLRSQKQHVCCCYATHNKHHLLDFNTPLCPEQNAYVRPCCYLLPVRNRSQNAVTPRRYPIILRTINGK